MKDGLEELFFWQFRARLPDFPEGELDLEGESPDVLVRTSVGIIGIEITKLPLRPPPAVAVFSERARVTWRASSAAAGAGLPNLLVHVGFKDGHPKRRNHDALVDELLERVKANIPDVGTYVTLEELTSAGVCSAFKEITIFNRANMHEPMWFSHEEGSIQENFDDILVEHIAQKERKLSEYLSRCDRCWLVLVDDNRVPPDVIRVSREIQLKVFQTGFERIFLMAYPGDDFYEFRTARPTTEIE